MIMVKTRTDMHRPRHAFGGKRSPFPHTSQQGMNCPYTAHLQRTRVRRQFILAGATFMRHSD
jgi:hypothetical protein